MQPGSAMINIDAAIADWIPSFSSSGLVLPPEFFHRIRSTVGRSPNFVAGRIWSWLFKHQVVEDPAFLALTRARSIIILNSFALKLASKSSKLKHWPNSEVLAYLTAPSADTFASATATRGGSYWSNTLRHSLKTS